MKTEYLIEPPADLSTLPPPPVPVGLDLRHFDCMLLDTRDLLESDIWDECSDAAVATMLRLWAACWRQVPCASLPNDASKVRKLAGCLGRAKRWKGVQKDALRGFQLCNDGRMYHHKVAKMAIRAMSKSRAGKIGANARWSWDTPLENNETVVAMAHSRSDGRPHAKRYSKQHGRPNGRTHAERGGDIPTPKSPPVNAGSGRALDGPPSRPDTPLPETTNIHGQEQRDGQVCVHYPAVAENGLPKYTLKISADGAVNVARCERDLEKLAFSRHDAIGLREKAIAYHERAMLEAAGQQRLALA